MRGILSFSEKSYEILKRIDFSEMKGDLEFNDEKQELELSDLELFQVILNEEIVCNGMNDQETVNDYGKILYQVYDEMLEQCE